MERPVPEQLKPTSNELFGITPELDAIIHDFAYLSDRHQAFHPANAGDVSQVLSLDTANAVKQRFDGKQSRWFDISRIQELSEIRSDGRSGYRSEGITSEPYYEALQPLAGRVMLITRTGADIPSLQSTIDAGQEGKLFVILGIDDFARKIQILYGNHEYGSIPSIETHIHLVSNAMSITDGWENPATVHAHPFHLITLGRDRKIHGDQSLFNAAINTQTEGVNRNHSGLIGVAPYYQSGSENLVNYSLNPLKQHRMVLWMNHGFVVRHADIRRGYTLMSYADDSACAALDSLRYGSLGLPSEDVEPFLREHNLGTAYRTLFDDSARDQSSGS